MTQSAIKTIDPSIYRCIATVLGPVGLRGEVKVRPNNDDPHWQGKLGTVLWRTPEPEQRIVEMAVTSTVPKKAGEMWMRFKGYNTRTALEAAQLMKGQIWVKADELPDLSDDEFYLDELQGMAVVADANAEPVAMVADWLNSSGMDYVELVDLTGKYTVVIPFNAYFFPTVDTVNQRLTVEPSTLDFIKDAFAEAAKPPKVKPKRPKRKKKRDYRQANLNSEASSSETTLEIDE